MTDTQALAAIVELLRDLEGDAHDRARSGYGLMGPVVEIRETARRGREVIEKGLRDAATFPEHTRPNVVSLVAVAQSVVTGATLNSSGRYEMSESLTRLLVLAVKDVTSPEDWERMKRADWERT